MKRRTNNADSSTLVAKKARGQGRQIKGKFQEQREEHSNSNELKPLNGKQKLYIQMIEDEDLPLVLASGYAGTSKTYIPTVLACDHLRRGLIDKIVFTRPNVSNSETLGYFGGGLVEKVSNWLMPVISILRERLGPNALELYIKNGDIVFVPIEVVKGYSASNCFFICDEAEDLTIEEAKKVVTRQGKNCKMILCGDVSQSELKERSGLKYIMDMADRHPNLKVGSVDFNDTSEIVRSDSVKQWIIAFNKEGK